MSRLARALILGASLLLPAVGAVAQNQDIDPIAAFTPFGFTRVKSSPNKPGIVESVLKEDDFIGAIPNLQQVGILNRDITQTAINSKPHMIESAFTVQMAPVVTHDLFEKNEKVMTCQFRQVLSDVDDYGAERKRLMFSYKFDRATDTRVKWDTLKTASFFRIAIGFKFEPWFMQAVNAEIN